MKKQIGWGVRLMSIDDYFRRIRDIAQNYLDSTYPAAPDPDLIMEAIATVIDLYNNDEEKG
jgi:hypothetical protein